MNLPKWMTYLNYNIYKEIDIFNFGVYELGDKEKIIYDKSYKFLMKDNDLLYDFYYLQLLLELVTRFKKEMNISDRSSNYLNVAIEDIKLSFRFQLLWYYNTSWIHLRWFFEKVIHFIIYYYIDSWKIKEIEITKGWKEVSFVGKTLKEKINSCLKIWELSYHNLENQGKEVFDKYYFPTSEVLKLYAHYSYDYVHSWTPTSQIQFEENEYKEIQFLMKITFIFIWRFIAVTIWETIEKYRKHEILKQVDDRPCYWHYLQFFFGYNKIFSNQFSGIYNLIHDNPYIKDFTYNKLLLVREELFSKEYLDEIDLHDKFWKESWRDKDKYADLREQYYNNK